MKCPDNIAEVLLEVLRVALVRIRMRGWNKDMEQCAIEADHVHNIPELLARYSPEKLSYYWETERPIFVRECDRTKFGTQHFEHCWKELESIINRQGPPT